MRVSAHGHRKKRVNSGSAELAPHKDTRGNASLRDLHDGVRDLAAGGTASDKDGSFRAAARQLLSREEAEEGSWQAQLPADKLHPYPYPYRYPYP